jgi:hypothetical protein
LIHFQKDWLDDVVAQDFEVHIVEQRNNILAAAGKKIVETKHLVPFGK